MALSRRAREKKVLFSVSIFGISVLALQGADGDNRTFQTRNYEYSMVLGVDDTVGDFTVTEPINSVPICNNATTRCYQRFTDTAGVMHWMSLLLHGMPAALIPQMPSANFLDGYMADDGTVALTLVGTVGDEEIRSLDPNGQLSVSLLKDGDILSGIGKVRSEE